MVFLTNFFEANKLNVAFWTAIIGFLFSFFQWFKNYLDNKLNVKLRIMQSWPLEQNSIGGCIHVFFLIANYSTKPIIIDSIELVQNKALLKPVLNGEKVVTVKWQGEYETMYSIPFPYSVDAQTTITEYVTYHGWITTGIDFDKPVIARIHLNQKKILETRIDKWNIRENNLNRIMFGNYHFPEK